MGSSRKHKERRSRSRSRSRERESRSSRHERRHRNKDADSGSRKRRHRREDKEPEASPPPSKTRRHDDIPVRDDHQDNDSGDNDGQGADSLSIEETNKLRAKLGLAPLDVGPPAASSGADDAPARPKTIEEQEIFVKTENISVKKQQEKLRERLELQRERRKILDKLKRVKGLADSDSEEDDPVAWIQKNREVEKAKAAEKARALAQQEEELERQEMEMRKRQTLYRDRDLSGITVGHAQDSFREGQQVILTLQDNEVLDEKAEDVLVNVNMIDEEKAAENVLNKKKGTNVYNPYDDGEEGEGRSLLYKYDEEIEGKKKEQFRIGTSSEQVDRNRIKEELSEMKNKLLVSLDTDITRKIASEYYTEEELKQFKKPKKKIKKKVLRKRNIEEDIVPLPGAEGDEHFGSRNRRGGEEPMDTQPADLTKIKKEPIEPKALNVANLDVQMKAEEDDYAIDIEDEAQDELQAALAKTRLNKKKDLPSVEKIAEEIVEIRAKAIEETESRGDFFLNSTAEFCRTLGDIPTYGKAGNRDDVDEAELEEELREERERAQRDEKEASSSRYDGSWSQVDRDDEPGSSIIDRLKAPILEEEPELNMGVAGALRLAMNKGYIEKDDKKNISMNTKLNAQNYTIEEKFYDDDKSKRRGADRYSGPVSTFQDKSGYKPDVKLDYVDDNGRLMTPKEAFRVLSHKFHGKGPGKNKIDKRTKKLDQESKLRQMSSIDTPLNTVQKLQEKQKELNSAYVIISGTQTTLKKK